MNQGVHTVDLLVAALGRPVEVFAYTGTLAHERIEVEDVAVGVVRFEQRRARRAARLPRRRTRGSARACRCTATGARR